MVQTPRRRFFLGCLALTLAYTVSGKLALLLAVPPGYASPIFPPAGIAVAAMLIGGPATLPWTFLGSLSLNIWIGYSAAHSIDVARVAAAIAIAFGSTLQAAFGGIALRRAVGYPAPLDNGRDLARLLLSSPVFCLTSATLSIGSLSLLGVVKLPDLLSNWASWWIGDTLGVLVVLPLMLIIAGEPRDLWRRRALPVGVPMVLFFALFVSIFVRISEWEQDGTLLEFRLVSREIVDKMRAGLEEQEVFLQQLERSFTLRPGLSPTDFQYLVQSLLQRFPLIQAVEWAPRIDATSRSDFETAKRGDIPGFEIREAGPSGYPQHAADRAQYYPVTYVEPLRGNEEAVGFDLASDRDRKAAVDAAITTGRLAATAPIRLVQEKAEQSGALLIFPVLGGPNGTGVLLVVHRMGTFLDGLLAPFHAMVAVRLLDLDAAKLIYGGLSPEHTVASYEDTFTFGGRRYSVATVPTASYLERHRRWQSWAVLARGVIGISLLGALLLLGTGYARRVEVVVEERTCDLKATNLRLQREIEERQQVEAALRQAQRMEAIGQLTGGIAHDFNNLMTVVSGNAALLSEQAPDDTVRKRASAIMRAVERGERLTRQLLAFSRRQVLRPELVDLRQRTSEILEMLGQALRGDIELTIDMPEDLWPVMVDPAELELALLNIGVNARDALPNGGRFHVEARNVSFSSGAAASDGLSGDFVMLKLSDTGTGMAPEVRARAFEPYFTTKEVGLGSGLGLSQVYGFAKQSGGTASIDSDTGRGATITLYLPRAAAASVMSENMSSVPLNRPDKQQNPPQADRIAANE
jgi:signal transduction histidine kinase